MRLSPFRIVRHETTSGPIWEVVNAVSGLVYATNFHTRPDADSWAAGHTCNG